ncbi:MAG: YgjP-like metallopeptidase domain-containing protein, partial [Candidatus Nitrosocosmicus sp.]
MTTACLIKKHKVFYKNNEIEFDILKTSRKKTCEITIKYTEILVKAPFSKSIQDIESLVILKAEWILKKIKENNGKRADIKNPLYVNGTTLPYLGENIILNTLKGRADFLEFSNNEFTIHVKKKKIKTIYEEWLFEKSTLIFNQFIEKYCTLLNVRPKKILIKNL